MKYYGRPFGPGLHKMIKKNLTRLGVVFEVKKRKSGWHIYRFLESEIPKLPQDGPGPYIPLSEENGYSFWKMTDKEWNEK